MLLDKYLPKYDFTEVHTIKAKASPEAAYRAVMEVTLAEISGIVQALLFISSLPDKFKKTSDRTLMMDSHKPMVPQLFNNGFIRLDEQEDREVVFGLIVPGSVGNVLKKGGNSVKEPTNREEFLAFKNPAYLWVVANFSIKESDTPGIVTLYTESRTMALSPQARKSFRPYWYFIRPWSGLIRRLMLRGAKKRAEGRK